MSIAALAMAGIILRPLRVPESVWAVGGAAALVCAGLLPVAAALTGIGKGLDVYLFLAGMMLLAEIARETGLFDWLAARAAAHARGSAARLFALLYLVGTLVTVFLSNDATAVVLTPAVAAVTRAARVAQPLPYLLICAFIANAASFVLPISNPANLVIFAGHMPPLLQWLPRFALPSALSIAVTYLILKHTQRHALRESLPSAAPVVRLGAEGKAAASCIALTALLLIVASASGRQLGLPTCVAGVATFLLVAAMRRSMPWSSLRAISWGVIPLVGGLFVLVEALGRSGAIRALSGLLQQQMQHSLPATALSSGLVVGFLSNLINNLPAGLIAGTAAGSAGAPMMVSGALLVGVDLGPNLSVTGSLATILWLAALRREGLAMRATDFLRIGLRVMPATLLLSLGALLLTGARLNSAPFVKMRAPTGGWSDVRTPEDTAIRTAAAARERQRDARGDAKFAIAHWRSDRYAAGQRPRRITILTSGSRGTTPVRVGSFSRRSGCVRGFP